jgi:hypothetical protein
LLASHFPPRWVSTNVVPPGNVKWARKILSAAIQAQFAHASGDCSSREPSSAGRENLEPARISEPEVQQLIELMRENHAQAPGVGLAPRKSAFSAAGGNRGYGRIGRTEARPVPFHCHRQPALELGPEIVEFYEGCLSVEGFQAIVPRRAPSASTR